MKIKSMRRHDWHRILRRSYRARQMEVLGHHCLASLLTIYEVTQPLTVRSCGETITIAAPGYTWLQVAEAEQPVWLTVMYDAEGRLVQLYFDITAGNRFDGTDDPQFRDLYLDIVMLPSGETQVLDEDELDAALAVGDVTSEEYAKAKSDCAALSAWLQLHGQALMTACEEARQALLRIPE